ncbi:2-dehydro-3-deoxygalactonokinase [Castellaniella sp.]|uniref:2-dehydro-3-deoxygalactonokinase n=1 Tax=Castellaniella sp. TaxID=1955812 RepID=UPI00356856E6
MSARTQYVGLDWGTSALRGYLFSQAGQVLAQRESPWGIMNLPEAAESQAAPVQPIQTSRPAGGAHEQRQMAFRATLWRFVGDWLQQAGTVPDVVACGMVGSAQGWCNVPYQPLPVDVRALAGAMAEVDAGQGVVVAIAPGLIEEGALPNVLRGEETQIAGVPALLRSHALRGRWLLGLPGTHSKWVRIQDDGIRHFDTFMTGEIFGALVQHTILGRTMQLPGSAAAQDGVSPAFLAGVRNAASDEGRAGLLSTAFSCRTLGLTGQLDAAEQHDYLSGLLIGHEIAGLLARLPDAWQQASMALVGREALCHRYRAALRHHGRDALLLSEDAVVHGLWALIRHRHPNTD